MKSIDLNEMLRVADEFLTISKNSKTFIPNFVNMSFSCEIYLKLILQVKTSVIPLEHNLEKLYLSVIEVIDEEELLNVIQDVANKKDFKVDYSINDIRAAVCKYQNLFVEYRYIFEKKKTNIKNEKEKFHLNKPYVIDLIMRDIAEGLHDYVHDKIKPEFSGTTVDRLYFNGQIK